jgi:hypothetical protein
MVLQQPLVNVSRACRIAPGHQRAPCVMQVLGCQETVPSGVRCQQIRICGPVHLSLLLERSSNQPVRGSQELLLEPSRNRCTKLGDRGLRLALPEAHLRQ